MNRISCQNNTYTCILKQAPPTPLQTVAQPFVLHIPRACQRTLPVSAALPLASLPPPHHTKPRQPAARQHGNTTKHSIRHPLTNPFPVLPIFPDFPLPRIQTDQNGQTVAKSAVRVFRDVSNLWVPSNGRRAHTVHYRLGGFSLRLRSRFAVRRQP